MEKLYTAQTTNDSTKANKIISTGRELSCQAWGTWDGATVGVYVSVDGTNGVLLDELTFTADGFQTIQVPAGNHIWAQLSGVGTSSLNCWLGGQGTD